MSIKSSILRTVVTVLCMVSMLFISNYQTIEVYAASAEGGMSVEENFKGGYDEHLLGSSGETYGFVILGTYSERLKIGDSFYLPVITSNGKRPRFSSDNSKVASVNTYGKITAKKTGTANITAKISNGEASCKVVVEKTVVSLNKKRVSLENGYSIKLTATSSTGHTVTWKSDKKSIASVDERGWVTAKKPGTATITATVDGTQTSCVVTVKQPGVKLNKTRLTLYRKETAKLSVTSSSKSTPKWKSNKSSVAVVDNYGNVTAVKNGTAVITVTVDGVKKSCEVTVKKPTISFATQEMSLAVGETKKLQVTVSSGNIPTFSSSNTNVVSVDEYGRIYGKSPGKAYVYAKEDGAKEQIRVTVE